MPKRPARLIPDPPRGLRERPRADGSVRIWWEPPAEARAKGMAPVELDEARLTWSRREAERLNREAGKGPRKRTIGITVGHVIDDYLATSLKFKRKKPATQTGYRQFFAVIREKWGNSLISDFTKPVINTWYETCFSARGKWMALSLIRHFSILFSHAELRGWRPENSNPCFRLGMQIPKGRRRRTDWAGFDALLAAADKLGLGSVGDAIALSTLAGQRQTDVVEAKRELIREISIDTGGQNEPLKIWVWQLTRSKRGNTTVLPLSAELVKRLAPRLDAVTEGPLLIDERTGTPYTTDRFRDRFEEVRATAIAAGNPDLNGLQFRDLRRTFGRLSREGGASKDDVADVLGNSADEDQYLGDVYMAPEIMGLLRAIGAVQRPQEKNEERKQA